MIDKRLIIYELNHGVIGLRTPPGKTPEPHDAREVFVQRAIEGPAKPPTFPNWYGVNLAGDIYRYAISEKIAATGEYKLHWNGMTGPPNLNRRIDKEDIPGEVRKALSWKPPQGR